MSGLQRANMSIDDLGSGDVLRTSRSKNRQGKPRRRAYQENRGGYSKPAPGGQTRVFHFRGGSFEFGANLFAQFQRSGFIKLSTLQRRAQGLRCSKSVGALPATLEVALELGGAHGIEFTIEIGMKEGPREITAHGAPPAEQVA